MPAKKVHTVTHAYINELATKVPRYEVHGRFDDFARGLLPERERILVDRMYKRSGVERRYSVMEPTDDPGTTPALDTEGIFVKGAFPSTAKRMELYDREAADLAVATIEGLDPDQVAQSTHLIICSCTGFAAPGLDLQLVQRLALPWSTQRTMVGFMGCYAALNSLRLADAIVRADPGAKVLVVALELCTLHMRETADLEVLLSFMIFGDGCAAALVSADPTGLKLEGFRTAVIPAAQGLITWHIGDVGFNMRLSGEVPGVLHDALPEAVETLQPGGVAEVELWAMHPGGRSVLDAADRALALPQGALNASRTVLREYGNMSSPSILFVLKELMRQAPTAGARGLAMAFGPGLTAEGMRFSAAPA